MHRIFFSYFLQIVLNGKIILPTVRSVPTVLVNISSSEPRVGLALEYLGTCTALIETALGNVFGR
jgi:hypothetical protein